MTLEPPARAGGPHPRSASALLALALAACAPQPAESGRPVQRAEASPGPAGAAETTEPRRLTVEVVGRHPHDPGSFVQGLIWSEGRLYESRGRYRRSGVRRIELESGRVEADARLPDHVFGEGLARVDDHLLVLTWRAGQLFVLDAEDLSEAGRWSYTGEGWGLAYHPEHGLVSSDGSHVLTFRDPRDFRPLSTLTVHRGGQPQDRLNELEFADGTLYANVYQTDQIVGIDPANGAVTAVIDAGGLLTPSEASSADVLNGIAHRPEKGTFLLTGKLWPWLFEVRFVETGG